MESRFTRDRHYLARQIQRQGIHDPVVLEAIESVPREAFLPPELHEFAYQNTPLPIGQEQTISQPYIVALMSEALNLRPEDRVLEIGTGSGYAAAVLSRIAQEVYTIERYRELADKAQAYFEEGGFENVHVYHGDGTLGLREFAPYDAIVVTAGGPEAPQPLLEQLRVGGRLVIPVGKDRTLQKLIRFRKKAEDTYERETLAHVRFVPLVGAAGWNGDQAERAGAQTNRISAPATLEELVRDSAEPFADPASGALQALLDRIGDCRLVLIGEATHGTNEFYQMRAQISRELITKRGFRFIAVEADWPDAARINQYVQHSEVKEPAGWQAFARFPTWMWRNNVVLEFMEWLREYNEHRIETERIGFYGLDLYSLYTSLHAVLEYLDEVDPETARIARQRYGCLTPWEGDPTTYGRAAISGRYRACEAETIAILKDLLKRRTEYSVQDGERFFDATRNAQLVADAERYYRVMYYGGVESWNLRDRHMFDTLEALLEFHGEDSKGILWAHNSHLGNAAATEMGARGETNVGALCRDQYGDQAYLIGQSTDHGTVAAAPHWEDEMEVMELRPSREESYEQLCHDTRLERFFLPLRHPSRPQLRGELAASRLQRAIGVVYRPRTEVQSHYFHASLPEQFDELIWFDESHALQPLLAEEAGRQSPTHPFALID